MGEIRSAGLVYGTQVHHLDHLAALCAFLQIPLVVTEPEVESLARRYYPQLALSYLAYPALGLDLVDRYEMIFSSLPHDLFKLVVCAAEMIRQKEIFNIWFPHGHSDKGHLSPFIEGLAREKVVLIYGQRMVDLLKEKGVDAHIRTSIIVGNLRRLFYQANKIFYDQLIEKELSGYLVRGQPTLLYAPTWEDVEQSCSLFDHLPSLLNTLPSNWNLIVKPHPNTLQTKEAELEGLIYPALKKPNLLLLKKFPPIYPLLNVMSAYLGDMSSIGYDSLAFNKPIFFYNPHQGKQKKDSSPFLFQYGTEIPPQYHSAPFSFIIDHLDSREECQRARARQALYPYIFGKSISKKRLRRVIKHEYLRDVQIKKNTLLRN